MTGAAQAPSSTKKERVPGTRVRKLREGEPKIWKIGLKDKDGQEITFIQDGLSFFEKAEFFGLVSEAIDEALERGLSPRDIMDRLDISLDTDSLKRLIDEENVEERRRALTSILDILPRVITKFLAATPRLLEETILLALGVAPEARSRVRPVLRQNKDDEMMFEILDTFVEQNARSLGDFVGRWLETGKRAIELISPNVKEAPSAE